MFRFTDCMGALAPIEATPEMTRPVGQRNGQLFVAPSESTIPDPSLGEDYDVIMVKNGEWGISGEIYDKLVEAEEDIEELNEGYDEVILSSENLLSELSTYKTNLASVLGIEPDTLTNMLTAISDGITAVRTAGNLFGSNIQTTDKFAESNSVYAAKITTAYNSILTTLHGILVDDSPSNIQNSLTAINNIKTNIKNAINALYPVGEEPIDNTTEFADYAQYIVSETPTGYYKINLATENTDFYKFYIDEFVVPTVDDNNDPVTTTLSKPSSTASVWPFFYSKKLIIPSYFTVITDIYGSLGSTINVNTVEEIVVQGNPVSGLFWYDTRVCDNLHKATSNQEYLDNSSNPGNRAYICVRGGTPTKPVTIDFPNLIKASSNAGGTGVALLISPTSDPGSAVPCTVNCPNLTILGNNSALNIDVSYCTGTYDFPSTYEVHGIKDVYYENTFKFPAITTFWNNSSLMSPQAPLHLYFGPDLASIQGSNGVNSLKATNVDIHIPAGDSATKTTLDNNSISYTQDYVVPTA